MKTKPIKIKKNLIVKRIVFIIMLLATLYLIFCFSAQDGEKSGNLSLKATNFIVNLFSKVKNMDTSLRMHYVERLHPIIRKLAHFCIYCLVGFSVMGFWCTFDIRNKYKLLWSILIGVAYAASDEFHQSFIPGRGPSIRDVCIDSAGVLTGIFIMIFLILLFEAFSNWIKK